MIKLKQFLCVIILAISNLSPAATVSIPNTFTANTPAVAAQVNANFNNVKIAVDDNDAQITVNKNDLAALLATVTQLQADLATVNTKLDAIENNTVLGLDGFLSLGAYDGYETAIFSGVNLQINNGTEFTASTMNGKGNLIIGYNESYSSAREFCSDPYYNTMQDCTVGGGVWAKNVHSGSHNLILGVANSYNKYSGIVAGTENVINNNNSSVLGGQGSLASGLDSVVVGGLVNDALGANTAILGGVGNDAIGSYSTVSGGRINKPTGLYSSISGGKENSASGYAASVSGGDNNSAGGDSSSVSGGTFRGANGEYDWRAGNLSSDF